MGWHCCVKRDNCGSGWAGTAVLRETTVVADGLAGVKSRSCVKSSPGVTEVRSHPAAESAPI